MKIIQQKKTYIQYDETLIGDALLIEKDIENVFNADFWKKQKKLLARQKEGEQLGLSN